MGSVTSTSPLENGKRGNEQEVVDPQRFCQVALACAGHTDVAGQSQQGWDMTGTVLANSEFLVNQSIIQAGFLIDHGVPLINACIIAGLAPSSHIIAGLDQWEKQIQLYSQLQEELQITGYGLGFAVARSSFNSVSSSIFLDFVKTAKQTYPDVTDSDLLVAQCAVLPPNPFYIRQITNRTIGKATTFFRQHGVDSSFASGMLGALMASLTLWKIDRNDDILKLHSILMNPRITGLDADSASLFMVSPLHDPQDRNLRMKRLPNFFGGMPLLNNIQQLIKYSSTIPFSPR